MGYETINYACGHSEQIQMYGKMTERTKRANYLGRYDCLKCRAKAAAENAKAAGLPVLQGSDKTIAWADQIRSNFIKNFAEDIAKAKELAKKNGKEIDAILLRALDLQVADILKNASAWYWIDKWLHREYVLVDLKKDSEKYIAEAKAEAKAKAEAEAKAEAKAKAKAEEVKKATPTAIIRQLNRNSCLSTLKYLRDFLTREAAFASGKDRVKWADIYDDYFWVYGKYCLVRNGDFDLISYPLKEMQNEILSYCKRILSLCKRQKIVIKIDELIVIEK